MTALKISPLHDRYYLGLLSYTCFSKYPNGRFFRRVLVRPEFGIKKWAEWKKVRVRKTEYFTHSLFTDIHSLTHLLTHFTTVLKLPVTSPGTEAPSPLLIPPDPLESLVHEWRSDSWPAIHHSLSHTHTLTHTLTHSHTMKLVISSLEVSDLVDTGGRWDAQDPAVKVTVGAEARQTERLLDAGVAGCFPLTETLQFELPLGTSQQEVSEWVSVWVSKCVS